MKHLKLKGVLVLSFFFGVSFFYMPRTVFSTGLSYLEYYSSYVMYPVLVIQRSMVDKWVNWTHRRNTIAKLEVLLTEEKKVNETLRACLTAMQSSMKYLNDTKPIVDFNQRYAYETKGLLAQVLVKRFSEDEHSYIINIGSSQGIEKDMVVLYQNCLVGRVVQVFPWYAKVRLISDKKSKVASYCAQTGASGIHEGTNDEETTILQHVSHLEQLTEGDTIISSGEGLVFPQGFALGEIKHHYKQGLYHTVEVSPLCNLRDITYCTVIAKHDVEQLPNV